MLLRSLTAAVNRFSLVLVLVAISVAIFSHALGWAIRFQQQHDSSQLFHQAINGANSTVWNTEQANNMTIEALTSYLHATASSIDFRRELSEYSDESYNSLLVAKQRIYQLTSHYVYTKRSPDLYIEMLQVNQTQSSLIIGILSVLAIVGALISFYNQNRDSPRREVRCGDDCGHSAEYQEAMNVSEFLDFYILNSLHLVASKTGVGSKYFHRFLILSISMGLSWICNLSLLVVVTVNTGYESLTTGVFPDNEHTYHMNSHLQSLFTNLITDLTTNYTVFVNKLLAKGLVFYQKLPPVINGIAIEEVLSTDIDNEHADLFVLLGSIISSMGVLAGVFLAICAAYIACTSLMAFNYQKNL